MTKLEIRSRRCLTGTTRNNSGRTDVITGGTILVVEDLALIRERILLGLGFGGYRVIEASDGQEGVDLYKSERPDAVFMDMMMPVMDGIEALDAIRAHDPAAQVSMLTAHAQGVLVETAMEHGAVDYVLKPFTGERLLAAAKTMIERRGGSPRTAPRLLT